MKRIIWAASLASAAWMCAPWNSARAETLFVPMNVNLEQVPPQNIVPPVIGRRPPRPLPTNLPFRVTSSTVNVRIDDNVATTTMEQTFLNLTSRDLEVRVMIPLPAGAMINNSALSMGDQMVEGKLYDSNQALSIYESIVNQRKDPALLRFAGENLYEARVFPIPPNQEQRLKFQYTQVLPASSGMYDYRHILSGSQLYKDGVERFAFNCTIRSKDPLGAIYSPSHGINVERVDERTAKFSITGANEAGEKDFRLFYATAAENVSMRVVAHRNSIEEDGYFMLIGRADDQLNRSKTLPKEIVFVADTSGSMQGEKIEQAKNALRFCVNSLNPNDRFNLITFSTDVQGLSANNLLPATKENIKKALAAIDQIEATGGTNIDGALRAALGSDFSAGAGTAKMVAFMTDGLPTVGQNDVSTILQTVKGSADSKQVRLFTFGVGNDVNTHLLDKLALNHDGASAYVAPKEDMEIKVSDFASKIRHPVMTDVKLDFGSARAHSIYPRRIPALYRGGEILAFGRFKGSGPGAITIEGLVSGEQRKITVETTWPERSIDNSYLPRVWAMRRIGHLVEDARLNGNNPEIVKEIVDLAHKHGIVTPYTSQLVLEPGTRPDGRFANRLPEDRPRPRNAPMGETDAFGVGGGGGRRAEAGDPFSANEPAAKPMEARERKEEVAKAATRMMDRSAKMDKGELAVAFSMTEKELQNAAPVAAPPAVAVTPADTVTASTGLKTTPAKRAEALPRSVLEGSLYARGSIMADGDSDDATKRKSGEALQRAEAESVRQVGARTFYLRAEAWIDSSASETEKPIEVKMYSKEYFQLLKDDATLGPVLALGGKITVMSGGKTYLITE